MIAVIDDTNTLIYIGQCKDELPSVLLEQDLWGNKSIYRHIQITERPPMGIITWDEKNNSWIQKPELSPQPVSDVNIADMKQRLAEQDSKIKVLMRALGV